MNNSGCAFAPGYIAADNNNTLTALAQSLELENIFVYYTTMAINLFLVTSRRNENYFISLKFDSD